MGLMDYSFSDFFLYYAKPLHYNTIPYNNLSERAIEVPIIVQFLLEHGVGKKILEVGNVLSNYKPLLDKHSEIGPIDVVDKFEVCPGVMNIDIMDFTSKYDIIVSISTIEHVGQDHYGEHKLDREAPLKAIQKIYSLLHPDGRAMITVPYGRLMDLGWLIQFNDDYMNLLTTKYSLPSEDITIDYFKKLDTEIRPEAPKQVWIQCKKEELSNSYFHSPFVFANGIAIIQLHKKTLDVQSSQCLPNTTLAYEKKVVIGDFYFHPFHKLYNSTADGWMTVDKQGFIFYGPHIAIEAGVYQFKCCVEILGTGHFSMDITTNIGTKQIWNRDVTNSVEIVKIFHWPTAMENVEIRLYNHTTESCSIRIKQLLLKPL